MASNKMLIDASHPEETRVVVLRGNRIEEFDFESQNKRQLKGNIYLAKVTRVEPSLQAAFVDYGGNRHGFLAFNEIHPDYYQIPVADRQALLEEEEAIARSDREAENARDSVETSEDDSDTNDDDDAGDIATEVTVEDDDSEEVEVKAKTKRRPRRPRRKAAAKPADDDAQDEGSNDPSSMAAMMEVDSISEAAPDDDASDDDGEDAPEETKAPAKRKTRSTSRPRKKTKAAIAKEEAAAKKAAEAESEPVEEEVAEEKPKKRSTRRTSRKKVKVEEDAPEVSQEEETVAEAAPAPKEEEASEDDGSKKGKRKRAPRKRRSSKKASDNNDDAGDNNGDSDSVESAGQEDAMEEVPKRRRARRQYKIQEVIKRRQVLLVQVVKEERGNKGAALTTYLSLAGRYSVLMPNTARGGGISRKITNSADRKRLKQIASDLEVPEGMGVILRTAGASRTQAEIQRDFEYLMRLWENVRALTLSSSAPCLVYEEGSLIKRSIRDLYDKDTGEVMVAGVEGHKEARDFMEMLMPSHAKNVKLYSDEQAMFARFGVEQQLDKMLSQQVTLKSGGYLVIDQTEALVAVDVNSGRATREHSIEDTALQTNLETAEEIARQLRLRDLAGLIVIDFIDMEEKRNNRAVEKKLKECLKHDRARIQIGRISHFGLLEMSRQRMRASVLDSTMDVCPLCQGKGHVRSPSSVGLHLLRSIEEHLLKNSRFDLVVKTASDIALYILNQKRSALTQIEERFGLKIFIEGSRDILGENFTMEKGEPSTGERKPVTHVQAGQVAADMPEEETTANETSNAADDENGKNRKRRRRRGRRGGGENNRNENSEEATTSESASETPSEEQSEKVTTPEAEEGDANRNKRRRGSRGGRNSRKAAPKEDDNVVAVEEATAPSSDVAEEATEATPRSRNSRPRKNTSRTKPAESKKEVEKPSADEAPKSKEAAPSEATEEKPARNKRRTSRKSSAKKDDAKDVADSDDKAAKTAPESEADEPDDKGKGKKKGGWWSRTGFFS